jgi:hypothetical protein
MGREKATDLLDKHANGTYLLRIRPQGPTHPNETVYALSLKWVLSCIVPADMGSAY